MVLLPGPDIQARPSPPFLRGTWNFLCFTGTCEVRKRHQLLLPALRAPAALPGEWLVMEAAEGELQLCLPFPQQI